MIWINLRIPMFRAPQFIGAEPVHRAAWLSVLAYCCEQENGGRIIGARSWKDRQWQQTCGVSLDEIDGATTLLVWAGNDLLVWEYPLEKESEIIAKRKAGAKGGKIRAAKHSLEDSAKHSLKQNPSTASSTPRSTATGSASTERKGIGREVERNGMETEPPTTFPTPPAEASPASPSRSSDGTSKTKDSKPSTPEAIAVAELFGRRMDTAWSEKEIKAFKDCIFRKVLTVETVEIVGRYYEAERKKARGIHRRDIKTFLNNFDGELDRAKAWAEKKAKGAQPRHESTSESL